MRKPVPKRQEGLGAHTQLPVANVRGALSREKNEKAPENAWKRLANRVSVAYRDD